VGLEPGRVRLTAPPSRHRGQHAGVDVRGLKDGTEADPDELTTTNGPMDAFQRLEICPGPMPLRPFFSRKFR